MNTPFLYKKCTTCGEWLVANTDNFGKDKRGKFGLKSQCKVCKKEYNKEYREKNKEYIKEYDKEYREKNKEYFKEKNKEYYKEHREYYKKYKEKNKEYFKEYNKKYNKEYYEDNKEYIKEYYKEYYKEYCKTQKGKENYKNNNIKYKNRLKSQGKGITTKQYKEMMNFFDWKCAYSNIPYEKYAIHKDYILPIANGGLNEVWNIVPMYKNYNSSKNDTLDVLNWYKEQEYFSEERLAKIVEWQQYAYDKWATEDDDPLILITDLYTGDDDIWLEK